MAHALLAARSTLLIAAAGLVLGLASGAAAARLGARGDAFSAAAPGATSVLHLSLAASRSVAAGATAWR